MRRQNHWNPSLMLLVAALAALPALAQYPELSGDNNNSYPGYLFLSASNPYLRLDMRRPGIVRTIRPGSGNTPPTFVGYSNYRGGRVFISTVNGDPFTTADDGTPILAQAPFSTYSTIRVGPVTTTGTTTTTDQVYEIETLYGQVDEPQQDPFVRVPELITNGMRFAWQIHQDYDPIGSVLNNTVIYDNRGLDGTDSEALIQVQQTYTLVRDMVRIEVELVNVGLGDQTVGVETYIDGSFGGTSDDGTSFYVNTYNEGLKTEFLFPSFRTTDDPGLRVLPSSWRSFDNERNPGVILGGVWRGGDITSDALSAGPPQEAMFVNASIAGGNDWGYAPLRLNLEGEDWAVLVRWQAINLSPGQAKRFITYFGLGGADSSLEQPYALSVEAPFSLELATGDDPQTVGQEGPEHVYRTPNPFELKAFVNNISTRPLTNMSVSVALPDGFRLAEAADSITKSIATVPSGQEQEVSWLIRSDATQRPGTKTITVSASGSGLNSKVIERNIGIPALPTLTFPSITQRLDMISVPYDFLNRDIEHIFGSLGNIGVTGGGNAAVARYDPAVRAYAFFPDPFITALQSGEGVWLFNGSLANLDLPSDRIEVPTNQDVGVALTPDWNMIGCPYTVPTRLFDCQVVSGDNVTRTFNEAVASGIVRPVLYEYSPNPIDPSRPGTYTFSGDANTLFNPWRGYWLRVLQPVTLVYRATNLIGPFRGQGPDLLRLRGGWEFTLKAEADGAASQTVQMGQDPEARDFYDTRDVEMPPPVSGSGAVRLAIVNPDWGRDSGAYLRDIRGPAGRTLRWLLRADSDLPNQEVRLGWNLRGVPADVQLTLVDLQTGARRHMRTSSGYVFNTGTFGGGRMLQVVATHGRSQTQIVAMQATAQRGRSVNIGFTLTGAATVDVVVESLTGRRVRTVARALEATAGQNAVGWDGRDDAGRPVPAGQYRCRVLLSTPDGQRAIAERIVIVNR